MTEGKKKKKASLAAVQGSQLPPDGSPISSYPNGCCVLIDHGGEVAWHMLLFRIGKRGPPFCGRMSHLPSSPSWNSQMGDSRSIPEATTALSSAWPLRGRRADGAGEEEDPLMTGELVEGSLMTNHLFSARHQDASHGADGEAAARVREETPAP